MIANPDLIKPCRGTEEVSYLESTGEQLYYVFHRASKPIAQVLLAGHFATTRPLAYAPWVRWGRYLAESDISALRFDYRGCGESTGEFHRFTLSSWLEDCRTFYRFLQDREPEVPIVLSGIGLGGLLMAHLFQEGLGAGMLLWQPSPTGSDAMREALLRRMAFDMANTVGRAGKVWDDYKKSLENGESIQAAGYTFSSALWREAEQTTLMLPEPHSEGGVDATGRPWRKVKLGQSAVPLVAAAGLWQALNPGVRVRRLKINPDLTEFFEENVRWIRANLKQNDTL